MNSDLKAQLRELNITAAKVGWTFSTHNWLVTRSVCVLIFVDVNVLGEWCLKPLWPVMVLLRAVVVYLLVFAAST